MPEGSCAWETGGYKGRTREVPKEELHRLIKERLGIPPRNIFSEYGMSELSSQAYSGAQGLFRFPPWARELVISPATGREAHELGRRVRGAKGQLDPITGTAGVVGSTAEFLTGPRGEGR